MNVLIGLTGSVSMLGMPIYLVTLKHRFPNIKVIMTQSANRFISREVLSLIVEQVYIDGVSLSPLELAEWADLFVVIPATANILGQAAHGLADSLLMQVMLSHRHPAVFFPSMNYTMWKNLAVQRNVRLLKERGHELIDSIEMEGYEIASQKNIADRFMPLPHQVIEILDRCVKRRMKDGSSSKCSV